MKYFLFFLFFSTSYASTHLDLAVIDEYLKVHDEFVKSLCEPGTENTYGELLKAYQGDGNYIPTLLDEKIDLKTIKSILPIFSDKINWINQQIKFVSELNDFSALHKNINDLQQKSSKLQELKKSYYFEKNLDARKKILTEAKHIFSELVSSIESLKFNASFLVSFKFPINHLALRAEYEKVKDTNDKEIRTRANSIFFFRKVVQDGTLDEDKLRSDAMYRAAFDTIYLSITNEKRSDENYFLTDGERVDLKYVLKNFEQLTSGKKDTILKRLKNWEERMVRAQDFYQNLVESKKFKISEDSQLKDVTGLLEERSKALYNLKEFVLNKEAKTYEYWTKKSELFQSLFALETILYSEVGRSDENVGFFRRDVAQVVLNRVNDAKFNQFGANDQLQKYIKKEIDTKKYSWLNVLFKEGEFSFTYFYIPGNLQIYCPDLSHTGKFLRKENLKISMDLLNHPRKDFLGVRYYSRVSMFGRFQMDSIWKDYSPVGENPGNEYPKKISNKLKEQISKGNFKYFYEFEGTDKQVYKVIEVKKQPIVTNSTLEKFYTYRNPHLFKFFSYTK